jgi:hypothetical protein
MIYELRTCDAAPSQLPLLLRRFPKATLPIWDRLGVEPIGFWTTPIGESNRPLTHMW